MGWYLEEKSADTAAVRLLFDEDLKVLVDDRYGQQNASPTPDGAYTQTQRIQLSHKTMWQHSQRRSNVNDVEPVSSQVTRSRLASFISSTQCFDAACSATETPFEWMIEKGLTSH